jgi:hypothetical protein
MEMTMPKIELRRIPIDRIVPYASVCTIPTSISWERDEAGRRYLRSSGEPIS